MFREKSADCNKWYMTTQLELMMSVRGNIRTFLMLKPL